MKFRKKPVVIDAVQLPGFEERFSEDPQWLQDALDNETLSYSLSSRVWLIRTLEDGPNGEAKHVGNSGDWLIRGVNGELYACKPDIFEATYEPAK